MLSAFSQLLPRAKHLLTVEVTAQMLTGSQIVDLHIRGSINQYEAGVAPSSSKAIDRPRTHTVGV